MAEKKKVKNVKEILPSKKKVEPVVDEISEIGVTPSVDVEFKFTPWDQVTLDDPPLPDDSIRHPSAGEQVAALKKERLAKLVRETNDYRIVEKYDEVKEKQYYTVTNKRNDVGEDCGSIPEANNILAKMGIR